MELKINALMIKSVDYKDNDKMLTLYSLEKGKIGAGIKGVKKAGAKLTFCTMPFCFAEYILNVKGDRYSVVGASEIESFYKIRLNVSSYYLAGAVSEFLIKFTEDGEINEQLFYLAVNTFKSLCFDYSEPENAIVAFINFWSEALGFIGYAADFFSCGVCGKTETAKKNLAKSNSVDFGFNGESPESRAFFDFSAGACVCENCYSAGKKSGVSEIMPSTLNAVRYAVLKSRNAFCEDDFTEDRSLLTKEENAPDLAETARRGEKFCVPEKGDFIRALKFLNHYTALKLGDGLKTVVDYIKII